MSVISSEWKLSAIKQGFTLPDALVFYMSKNPPSPEVYHKLIRCCKYFWLKNSAITLNFLGRLPNDKYWETHGINGFQKYQKLKIETLNEKLWIHDFLGVYDAQNEFMASLVIPRIHRCDITNITLSYQTLSFEEFKKITSSGSVDSLYLGITTVKNDDGTIVPIEKLIELLPKLQMFDYYNVRGDDGFRAITSETAANLNEIRHFFNIKSFTIKEIPEAFNIEAFFATPKV